MGTAAACQVTVETDAIEVECHSCGTTGTATSETGDVMDRVREFARSHLAPHVTRAHFLGTGDLGTIDLGWFDWTDD